MKKLILPVSLGLAHGVSDCSAGMLLGSLTSPMSIYGIGILVLIYNLIAFGGQPLAGVLTDKLKNPRLTAIGGIVLMCAALGLFYVSPIAAVITAGIASAAFHVGGGALALCSTPDKASGPGLFSAPGVAGLAIGGFLAVNGVVIILPLIILLFVIGIIVLMMKVPLLPYSDAKTESDFDKHDMIMFILLLAIALRSAVWNIFQYIEQGNVTNIILISFFAAGGKIFGGFMADRIGWRRYSFTALLLSIPLLILGENSFYFLLPGVALLQSVTPVLVSSVYKSLPKMPATTAGLSFGLAIAAGGLPFITGFDLNFFNTPYFITGTIVLTAVIIWFGIKTQKRSLQT
jgi:FSR family fosmidomycin resistance protein-like MFS transporter